MILQTIALFTDMSENDKSKDSKHCNRCGVPMKILNLEWGDKESENELITILGTLIDEDDVPKDPIDYSKLDIEYCTRCGSIDVHIE